MAVLADVRGHPVPAAWRRDADIWRANVIYSVAVGIRHIDWVDANRVRVA